MTNHGRPPGRYIIIYTDGACPCNPGNGGWAAILCRMDGESELKVRRLSGNELASTNNRMELTALIKALEFLQPNEPQPVHIVSDSKYVVDGMTIYREAWKARGWRNSDKKVVANVDLWRALDALAEGRVITFEWVRGHAGDPRNEEVDRLASAAAARPIKYES